MRKLIVIALAAFLATAAVAIAASTDQGRRLTGPFCINKTTGIVRSVALLHTGTCKASEVRRVGVAVPLTPGPKGDKGDTGATGATGPAGRNGTNGQDGAPGDSYLAGAYYSVAYYDVGDTNGGAIATVACKSETDTAISGGVSVDDYTKNVPVGQSFPGRMDWTTNTPKPDRLDGWIVQFASQNESAPLKVKVWALCVPGLVVPVEQTYTESD